MAKRNYIIYSDESDRSGRIFSNFFGGVLLKSSDREIISNVLNGKRFDLNLDGELKWSKVSEAYLEKYIEFMEIYFSFVRTGRLKVRIMFTQNAYRPAGLSREQKDSEYFFLYYQFFKHAFGIRYCNPNSIDRVYFSIFPDQIPDSREKIERFRDFVCQIPHRRDMNALNVFIPRDQIADVDSKNHVILQGLDVILGSMSAKLNEKLTEKPEGARIRGRRTRAKEKLYKFINRQIREIYPNFNVGISTGTANGKSDRWHHPYRHWNFRPHRYVYDANLARRRRPR